MSTIYLIRHGQAGLRSDYDQLSETGRRQAQLLGAWFLREGVQLDDVRSGELHRQRQTAAAMGLAATPDARWNEFDLDAVSRVIGPRLAASDDAFRVQWVQLQRESADASSGIHRRWTACDVQIVRAWIENRYPPDGVETWQQFRQRVTWAIHELAVVADGQSLAILTSATPVALCLGAALQLGDREIMRLAGALYNTGVTVLRVRHGELHLSQFNSIAHLEDPQLRTYR